MYEFCMQIGCVFCLFCFVLFVVALISILFLSLVVVGVKCCSEPAKSLVVGVIFQIWLFSMFRSHWQQPTKLGNKEITGASIMMMMSIVVV